MKTIGLIGGLTWYSSLEYYRIVNEEINKRLGGDEAARMVINSVNFGEIKKLTHQNNWNAIETIICNAARKTEEAGAECLLIGANTMHKIATQVQQAVNIPVIHIADATAAAIKKQNIKTVALLGTKYTMQLDFYKSKLAAHGIETLIPNETDVEIINNAIYEELDKGIFKPETREKFLSVINGMIKQGAEGIILGCTEIPLLIKQEDCTVPVFDTGAIHANAAVDFALS